jgi:hypothetical protein
MLTGDWGEDLLRVLEGLDESRQEMLTLEAALAKLRQEMLRLAVPGFPEQALRPAGQLRARKLTMAELAGR